jgi:hypothetical protein
MKNLLNQFKALPNEEKVAFMKEAMPHMAEIFKSDPQKMMAEMMPVCMNMMSEMMPFCMNMMKSKGMDPDMMRAMIKNMMGQP